MRVQPESVVVPHTREYTNDLECASSQLPLSAADATERVRKDGLHR